MNIHGDCLIKMAKLESNSIDAIVTDPPYGLEFMGKEWDRLGNIGKLSHSGIPERNSSTVFGRTRVNYNGNSNRKCHKCHRWEWDYPERKCVCESPDFPNVKAHQARIMQDWHYAWAVEALHVAKPGCHLLAFGGTRTFHRLACAIEDAGWEIRDCLMWVYGSGFPKSHNLKGDKEGWGTALKPAWEPIILARKPLEGTVAENVQKWGTGAINVDGCRIEAGKPWYRPNTGNGSRKFATTYAQDKWTKEQMSKGATEFGSKNGRWPANLIHDGSEEVLAGFPNSKSGGENGKRTRPNSPGWGMNAQTITDGRLPDSGSAARFFYCARLSREEGEIERYARDGALVICKDGNPNGWELEPRDLSNTPRFFYCAKASRVEREMGLGGMENNAKVGFNASLRGYDGKVHGETRLKNHHPTVKPLALMRYLCRLITPPGGIVLDLFMGSGTTGMACKAEGFEFIGIELDGEYHKIAEKRINAIVYEPKLIPMVEATL